MTFTNELGVDYWLSVYNFCQAEVIFQNLFTVKSTAVKDLFASYVGPVDFVADGSKTVDQFLKMEPNSSLSCELNIGQYYLTQHAGTYSVKFVAENPGFKNQPSAQLVSNEVSIELLESGR